MEFPRIVVLICVLVLLACASGCGDFFVGDDEPDYVRVTPAAKLLAVDETQQYKASVVTVGGDTIDATSSAAWTSSDTTVATVNSSGLTTAVSADADNASRVEISAESGSESDTVPLVVTSSPLQTLTVGPANHLISAGGTLQLTATGTLEDSSEVDLTDSVIWTSQDTTVARVNSTGLVTASSTGTALTVKITASIATSSETKTDDIELVIQ